jgi:hypothetical protein
LGRKIDCEGVVKIFVIGGVPVDKADANYEKQSDLLRCSMQKIGADIVKRGHDLIVCSPFSPSADVDAVRGAAKAIKRARGNPVIEFHYPDQTDVRAELDRLVAQLRFQPARYGYRVALNKAGKIDGHYGWLLPQVSAMDHSHVVIGLGGHYAGAASLLFGIAQSRRKPALPLTFLGGAAASAFQSRQYELEDRLKVRTNVLHNPNQVDRVIDLAETLGSAPLTKSSPKEEYHFFISYARSRPQEADFVEMTLRRRNYDVVRDERDFGAGRLVQSEIIEHIHRANVFIVIWCKEYACSPWCFDEFEIALKRQAAKALSLWILQVDETRIVPPAARCLIAYPVGSRKELEGQITQLLGQRHSESRVQRRKRSRRRR